MGAGEWASTDMVQLHVEIEVDLIPSDSVDGLVIPLGSCQIVSR